MAGKPEQHKRPKAKTPWQHRLEVLQSVCLSAIAYEVNGQRWTRLLARLESPTADDKIRLRRLVKRQSAGNLSELPSDMRADPTRMKRALVALHRLLGNDRQFVVTVERIAREAGMSLPTTRRAILDLDEANLISVRRRERTARRGGQGPSEYFFVWPTLIDLAMQQGLQRQLGFALGEVDQPDSPSRTAFALEAPPSRTAATILSDESDRDRDPAGCVETAAPSHCDSAPSHRGRALSHCDSAPSHKGGGYARADALSLSSISSPSFSKGDRSANTDRPREKEKNSFSSQEWKAVVARLSRFGISLATQAAEGAWRNGWSPDQVNALLGTCEQFRIGDVYGFPPGLVCTHLRKAEPGVAIGRPLSETFQRAKRDREMSLRRAAEAQRQPAQAIDRIREQRLEAFFGPMLDGMERAERDELARQVLSGEPFTLKLYHRACEPSQIPLLARLKLLAALCDRRGGPALLETEVNS